MAEWLKKRGIDLSSRHLGIDVAKSRIATLYIQLHQAKSVFQPKLLILQYVFTIYVPMNIMSLMMKRAISRNELLCYNSPDLIDFPASRDSFPGVCWQEKRDLCHGSKMATLSMLPSLATEPSHVMFVTSDGNKTIDKPRLGQTIRFTSSLQNVISTQQF